MFRAGLLAKPFTRRAVSGQRVNTISTAPKNWMDRLLSTPKGWEKYYRKPGSKGDSAEAAGAKTGPKTEKKAGGGGGGGNKKPEDNQFAGTVGVLAFVFAISLIFTSDFKSGRYCQQNV